MLASQKKPVRTNALNESRVRAIANSLCETNSARRIQLLEFARATTPTERRLDKDVRQPEKGGEISSAFQRLSGNKF